MEYQKGISVIICCYNSAARLPKTLEHLAAQQCTLEWELIIVDNNSTDDTATIATNEWNKYETAVACKVVFEQQAGLSYARKKGIATARYGILIFCDDDNWLDTSYLRTAYVIMQENPDVAVAGGMSQPFFESSKPRWFDAFANGYAVGKQLASTGIANRRRYISGAGMVIRKPVLDTLQQLSFENILSDRKGAVLSSGGDAELCLVILFLGYDLYYDEQLQFVHFIPAKRSSWQYCSKMMRGAHGLPQVYFSFYKMIYDAARKGNDLSFPYVYKQTLQNIFRITARNFFGIRNFFSGIGLLFFEKEGSMRSIRIKAGWHTILFLWFHKKQLEQQFAVMSKSVFNIVQHNKTIHGMLRECFFVSNVKETEFENG